MIALSMGGSFRTMRHLARRNTSCRNTRLWPLSAHACSPVHRCVFTLAGFVKGVTGLVLPTISVGLLALILPLVEAAAILILPSFVTNVWQLLAGPAFGTVVRRLWPMMLAVCIGTWAGLGLMTGAVARGGTALLGGGLVVYAIGELIAKPFPVLPSREPFLGPPIGLLTGLMTAVIGVFVIPAVPYLQALDLDKEEFVEALGLSFTVSTIALAVNVTLDGGLQISMAASSVVALAASGVGMAIGQAVRLRMSAGTFRRWLFCRPAFARFYLIAHWAAGLAS